MPLYLVAPTGDKFLLAQGESVIGSDPNVTIPILAAFRLAAKQAVFRVSGKLVDVTACDDSAPVLVNGLAAKRSDLNPGDKVTLGLLLLTLVDLEETKNVRPADLPNSLAELAAARKRHREEVGLEPAPVVDPVEEHHQPNNVVGALVLGGAMALVAVLLWHIFVAFHWSLGLLAALGFGKLISMAMRHGACHFRQNAKVYMARGLCMGAAAITVFAIIGGEVVSTLGGPFKVWSFLHSVRDETNSVAQEQVEARLGLKAITLEPGAEKRQDNTAKPLSFSFGSLSLGIVAGLILFKLKTILACIIGARMAFKGMNPQRK